MEPPTYSVIKAEFGNNNDASGHDVADGTGANAERSSSNSSLELTGHSSIIQACEFADSCAYYEEQGGEQVVVSSGSVRMQQPPTYSVIKAEFGDCDDDDDRGESGGKDELLSPTTTTTTTSELADDSSYEQVGGMKPPTYSIIKAEFGDDDDDDDHADILFRNASELQSHNIIGGCEFAGGVMEPPTYSIIKAEFGDSSDDDRAERSGSTELLSHSIIKDCEFADSYEQAGGGMEPPTYSVIKAEFGNGQKKAGKGFMKTYGDIEVEGQSSHVESSSMLNRDESAPKPSLKKLFRCCFHSHGHHRRNIG